MCYVYYFYFYLRCIMLSKYIYVVLIYLEKKVFFLDKKIGKSDYDCIWSDV